MIIPVMYPSAAEFWLNGTHRKNLDRYSLSSRKLVELPDEFGMTIGQAQAARAAKELSLKAPLSLMAPDNSKCNRGSAANYVRRRYRLPAGSFVEIRCPAIRDNRILMATPEYVFLQAASRLSFHDLLILGMQLCAMYVYDADQTYKQRRREPITSAESIRAYLSGADGIYGVKSARRAARYLLDNSNSPQESIMALWATLPLSQGGFALPTPRLNGEIVLNDEARAIYGRRSLRCDMVWDLMRVVFEYESAQCHNDIRQVSEDIARQNALAKMDYHLVRVTNYRDMGYEALEEAFLIVRKLLGVRDRPALARSAALRRELLQTLNCSPIFNMFRD